MKKIYSLFMIFMLSLALMFFGCKDEINLTIKGERNVLEGEQITLSIETNLETYDCIWSSSNPEIANVNNSGVVTGIKEGTSTIKVVVGDITKDALITVSKFEIMLSVEKYLHIGDKTKIEVTHNSKLEKDVFFSSSEPEIITIDENGNIEALAEGKANITATIGGTRKTVTISVLKVGEEIPVDDPEPIEDPEPIDDPTPRPVVDPLEIYVPKIIRYDDCFVAEANREVHWYSYNENILMFNEMNEVVPMDAGCVTIKAVDVNNKDAYVEMEVYVVYSDIPPVKIQLLSENGQYEVAIERVGAYVYSSLQLVVKAIDSDPNADLTVIWKVDNENVASISSSGLLVPNTVGTVKVTATSVFDSEIYATLTIKVVSGK